jgi:hypothetical protein
VLVLLFGFLLLLLLLHLLPLPFLLRLLLLIFLTFLAPAWIELTKLFSLGTDADAIDGSRERGPTAHSS